MSDVSGRLKEASSTAKDKADETVRPLRHGESRRSGRRHPPFEERRGRGGGHGRYRSGSRRVFLPRGCAQDLDRAAAIYRDLPCSRGRLPVRDDVLPPRLSCRADALVARMECGEARDPPSASRDPASGPRRNDHGAVARRTGPRRAISISSRRRYSSVRFFRLSRIHAAIFSFIWGLYGGSMQRCWRIADGGTRMARQSRSRELAP